MLEIQYLYQAWIMSNNCNLHHHIVKDLACQFSSLKSTKICQVGKMTIICGTSSGGSTQYTCNHQQKKNIICPITHPNPNCTLCPHYQINTWPHLLSACSIQHINGLRIARHNIAIHKVAHTLQSNKHTICYNLLNASNQHSRPQDNPIPTWFLQWKCNLTPCTCMAKTTHPLCTRSPEQ